MIEVSGTTITGDEDNFVIYPMSLIADDGNTTVSDYYILPDKYTIAGTEQNEFEVTYCLTDTAITADLAANAEITLNVSDDNPDETYATIKGKSGDTFTLTIEHDSLIDREFTEITFSGVMYDTLTVQETEDGIDISGIKSGTFEITSADGTVTTKNIENVSENAQVSAVVNPDSSGDVIVDGDDILKGDANRDGEVNSRDAALILRHAAGYSVDIDLKAADVTGDGDVNSRDAALILRKAAGYDVTFK